eukprot:1095885-Rhodomonas_salina.1
MAVPARRPARGAQPAAVPCGGPRLRNAQRPGLTQRMAVSQEDAEGAEGGREERQVGDGRAVAER